MKIVWSYWPEPMEHGHNIGWLTAKHHLLAWILSLRTAQRHYGKTALFTNDKGRGILIDGLGLDFKEVSTCLNALDGEDSHCWVLGKLIAYREQQEPFVHIDTDVFLWKPLPQRCTSAPLCAQNPESWDIATSSYVPEAIEYQIKKENGWYPEEFSRYLPLGGKHSTICCGFLGGQNHRFLSYYADLVLAFYRHACNRQILSRFFFDPNITLEQYYLTACLDYHGRCNPAVFADLRIEYLFETMAQSFDPVNAEKTGFTHLLGSAKHNGEVMTRLENRVRKEYPDDYERCIAYVERHGLAVKADRPAGVAA